MESSAQYEVSCRACRPPRPNIASANLGVARTCDTFAMATVRQGIVAGRNSRLGGVGLRAARLRNKSTMEGILITGNLTFT